MKDIINEIESSEGEDANVKNNLDANMRDIDDVNVMDKMHVNESEDENTDDTTDDDSIYDTEDELDSQPIPANFFLVPNQTHVVGQPVQLDVEVLDLKNSRLPLCLLFNARSLYNKVSNLRTMLHQVGADLLIISETWELKRQSLEKLLDSSIFKTLSYCRKTKPGGGSAIIYNESRFEVTKFDLQPPENVEATWAVFTPKSENNVEHRVKKILVGAIYVSPRSKHKEETIDHIIEAIHAAKAQLYFFLLMSNVCESN